MEYGAQEPTSQEGANDGHDDIDQQAPAVMHDLGRDPTDYCGNDEIDNDVHFFLLRND